MPSPGDLLARHDSVLWIDAASAAIQVGILKRSEAAQWCRVETDAGTGVFRGVAALQANPGEVAAFVFCEGPGSVLGIRTAAMAIRAWTALLNRPVYAYRSLELVARGLGRPGISVIADARRETWHCLTTDAHGAPTPVRRVATADLGGTLVTPAGFRAWSALPPVAVETVTYDLAALLPGLHGSDFLRPTADPDAFLHEEPTYVTWTPEVHRSTASG